MHAPFDGGVMNGHCRLLHVVEPVLVLEVKVVEPLGHDAAVRVAAATGLAHVELHVIGRLAMLAAGGDVEVRREHRRGHVAHL